MHQSSLLADSITLLHIACCTEILNITLGFADTSIKKHKIIFKTQKRVRTLARDMEEVTLNKVQLR